MLELARGEHAVALQTVTEPPPEDDLGGAGAGAGEERRGRRPSHAAAGEDKDA
jgi:hypothetical protein